VRLEAVLFDATGVLIEPAESVGETYARAARAHGAGLPPWRLEDAFRRVVRRAPPRAFSGRPPTEVTAAERDWWRERVRETFQAADSTVRFDDFDAFFGDLFERFASGDAWRARAGALEALRTLRADGLATGVVSNFDHRLPVILQDLGIATLLDVTVIPAACGASKPDPAAFRAALTALGVDSANAVYVGHDPEIDLAGASAAGLLPLALPEAEGLRALPARIARIANLGA